MGSGWRWLGAAGAAAWLVAGATAGLHAQVRGSGSEPVVTELELYGALDGGRAEAVNPRRAIELAPRQSITLEAEPRDQYGRRFPLDRFRMGAELDRDCRGLLSVSERAAGELAFTAGRERGSCGALVWVAGNLNLAFELRFDVGGLGTDNYTRAQAEAIAARLYRGILQREIDGPSRDAAVAEIQRGRIENQVQSMVDSGEFAALRDRQSPQELLAAFYRGLLGRAPDAGARDYATALSQRRYVPALMNLIQSSEFEQAILDVR